MPSKDIYTDPELHDEIKEEIQASDKGGAPGQWSARKAQFVAKEYKKQGGGYKDEGKPDEKKQDDQKNLENWGKEDWQTKEGSGNAKDENGDRKRYLPKEAWENMTEEEKQETERKKLDGSKEGKQFVGNAEGAKQKGKEAREKTGKKGRQDVDDEDEDEEMEDADDGNDATEEQDDDEDEEEAGDKRKRSTRSQTGASNKKQKSNSGDAKSNKTDADQEDENYEDDEEAEEDASSKSNNDNSAGSKSNSSKSNGATHGSKHDSSDEPAPKGSNDRLPKKGQEVSWKAMPGWVHGKVVEVVTEDKTIHGKHIKASKDEPRIALEAESGKFCVHKPDNCYFGK